MPDRTEESNEGTFWRITAAVRLKHRETTYSNNYAYHLFPENLVRICLCFSTSLSKGKKKLSHTALGKLHLRGCSSFSLSVKNP